MSKTASNLALKNILAEKELINNFRYDYTWLETLTPKPQWVVYDAIKIPKI